MKEINLYEMVVNNKTTNNKNKTVKVAAKSVTQAISALTYKVWNSETKEYQDSEFLEDDIKSINLIESNIIIPDYI